MRNYILLGLFLLSTLMSAKKLKEGTYRGVLVLNPETGIELPFNFEVKYKGKKPLIIIRNGDERITVDEIKIKGDSVNFKMPVFDTEFKTKLVGSNLEGVWINHYRSTKNKIAFTATFGEQKRFLFEAGKADPIFEGKWEVDFSPDSKETSKAIALFHHNEQTDFVSGTFLTETGDYRFLEGMKNGNKLYLSCFDGSHAFLFTVDYTNGALQQGKFYSGAHWQENWQGKRNENFYLANAEEITLLKDPKATFNFVFPNLEGKLLSLNDKRFENKPVIIQVMGSWCPNCMDESAYFSELYKQYNNQGLEIVALAFEKTNDPNIAKKQVTRLKNRFGIQYPILITLLTGKEKAMEVLPMLNKITSFPTTLFLNKQHKVVKIHTGFIGPATGMAYLEFKNNTESLIKNLLKE